MSFFMSKDYIVGKDIVIDDVKDFYYTYHHVNYNPEYQRYRFYKNNDEYIFFHDLRKKDGYGFLDENDSIRKGEIKLNKEEWEKFYSLIIDGKVIKKKDNAESGDSGPWMYLYWKNDKDKYQEYYFASYEKQLEFKEYCESLIEK